MKKCPFVSTVLMIVIFIILAIPQQSCHKKGNDEVPVYLTVDLPTAVQMNDLYYQVGYNSRYIELEFSQALDTASVQGNLTFKDKFSTLDTSVSLITLDRKIVLMFHPSFQLQAGWKYSIILKTAVKSFTGLTFPSDKEIDIRTPAFSLFEENDSVQRNAILCISDIHMGEARAVNDHYCWFSKNANALCDLLDYVVTSKTVREIVILGDLFDEWVIPYRYLPFDTAAGITDSREYFISVTNTPVNLPVVTRLRAIAQSGAITLNYIPGNHDMLLTQSVLEEIIPGIKWKGTVSGLGDYSPVDEIIMEHGHRFDLFNCPQPFISSGHMLPPGYFVSRLQAERSRVNPVNKLKESLSGQDSPLFSVAWRLSLDYLEVNPMLTVHEDSLNIPVNGVGGWNQTFSFNSARDMYKSKIESKWDSTQSVNRVPRHIPVLMAILDGTLDLFTAVTYEYLSPDSPKKYKMAVMGHTHKPELKVFPPGKNYSAIYANSGSWVNAEMANSQVRTFLMIWPGKWTNSDLDIVSLYQYNLESGNGLPDPHYSPVLMAEESILRGN